MIALLLALAAASHSQSVALNSSNKLIFPTLDSIRTPVPKAKATVLIFVATECPIANRYSPEIARIDAEYSPRGVRMIRVYPDGQTSKSQIVKHSSEYGLTSPAVRDPKHLWVKLVGATVTPEAVVISPESTLLYRGRIDDRNVEHGRIVDSGFRRDLRIALDETLAGKPVAVKVTPAIGCFISSL